MFSYTVVGNWLFLMGSLLFTFDAINNAWVSCSIRSFLILAACCFFTIGCILFLLDNSAKADSQQERVIVLTERDADKVFDLLENRPVPNAMLQEAAKKHKAFFHETH